MDETVNYEDRVVCFLDILGFSTHIRRSIDTDGSDDAKKIKQIARGLTSVRRILDIDIDVDRQDEYQYKQVTQFSDSIVISFPARKESGVFYALLDIMWVQINLLNAGMLCRGAIARGKMVHTKELAFGPALVEAYLLESKAAIYPRVILGDEIISTGLAAHAKHHYQSHEEKAIMDLLSRDSDGMYYVDYVTKAQSELDEPELDYPVYLYNLRKIVKDGMEAKDPSVRIKYQWLHEKLSPHLSEIGRSIAMLEPLNELRLAYEKVLKL